MGKWLNGFLVALCCSVTFAQVRNANGSLTDLQCVDGKTPVTASGLWTCADPASGGVAAGAIVFIDSGTCPAGYSEVSALNGRMARGTVAANGNVGGTGGSDSVTPTVNALTAAAQVVSWPASVPTVSGIAASFSGNALATHAHELPWQIASTTTIRQIAAATFGVGTSRAATAVSAAGTANTTSAAVALSEAKSAGTPAGTVTITNQGAVAWPASVPTTATSAVTGTLNAVDNRAAYVNLIGCKKT